MKYIVLTAVAAVVLLQLAGAIPDSSVGGPMTLMMIFLAGMLAVAIYEAWSARRGVLGWIVNIIMAVVGGMTAAMIGGLLSDVLLSQMPLNGSLASTRHPMLYVMSAGMMLISLFGSWITLMIINRMR